MYRSAPITRSYMRALNPWFFCLAIAVMFLPAPFARAQEWGRKWVATWATAPATFFVYTPPVPQVYGARQLQLDVSDSYNSRFCGRL